MGRKTTFAEKLSDEKYSVHYRSHCLNLVIVNSCQNVPVVRNFMWRLRKTINASIKSRTSKKDRQHNGKKRTNSDLQDITEKTKDRTTRIPLKTGVNSGAPEGCTVPVPYVAAVVLLKHIAGIPFAPLGHINLIPSQPVSVLTP